MAGTRRIVERLGVLLVSVTISVLVFQPLMIGGKIFGGLRDGAGDPAIIAVLLPSGRNDSLVTEALSAPIDSVIEIKGGDDPPPPIESHESFVSRYHDVPGTGYLPASMLTQRPIVLLDVHPELPASLQGVEPQFVDLLLLINTYGDVDQVLLESLPTLSAAMVQELRQHFQVMRFIPGQWEGQAVPSALRIRAQLHP
jgi:hypothetical protein